MQVFRIVLSTLHKGAGVVDNVPFPARELFTISAQFHLACVVEG